MKKYVHLTLVLFIIAALSGLILAGVNELTKGPIAIVEQEQLDKGMKELFSNLSSSTKVSVDSDDYINITEYYEVTDEAGTTVGYVINVNAPEAYDEIIFLVGLDTEGKIVGTSYLSLKETPGLGVNVDPTKASNKEASNKFNDQLVGLTEVKNGDKFTVDTIAGATISSSAVLNGIDIALDFYNSEIK